MKRIYSFVAALLLIFAFINANAHELLLGSGDELKISVYNNPDLAVQTRVSEDGLITFPLLGQVDVAGLSVAEAESKISHLLEVGGFLKNAHVNIYVTLLQSQLMSVLGQVNHPGRYPVDGHQTVMDMVALAGGVGTDGGDTVILIRKEHGVTTKHVIDITDMARSGEMSLNFEIIPGDVVFVERTPHFYIYGEVQKPGEYRLEKSMTVVRALAAGSGLTPRGTERGLRIKRHDASGKLITINANNEDYLQPDDVVYVQESLF